MNPQVEQVLKALGEALKMPLPDELVKAWMQSASPTSGITAYDLEAPAKHLFPVLTPLRNIIPRVGGGVGTAINWRAVTGINTNNMEAGVSEGNRGGVIAHTTADYTAAYKGIGLEDYVTFEADYAAKSFDDAKALAVMALLNALMIQEEILILGGNTSIALGITPTPTAVGSTTGGTLPAATYSVICVALTMNGVQSGSVAGGIRGSVTRTNADGVSTDTYGGGSAQKSAAGSFTVASGSTGSATVAVAPVNGAAGYAWYWGAAGAEVLGAISTLNSIVITANATGTQTAASMPTSDNSRNSLAFDGILTQCLAPGSGAYVKSQPAGAAGVGTGLTSDNAGGIVEFDALLKDRWDNFRLSPDTIWVSSQEQQNLQVKILAAPNTAAHRFVFNVQQGKIMGGTLALSYLNKFGMSAGDGSYNEYAQAQEIPIKIHPFMPAGTVLFTSRSLPYKLNNVANVLQVKTRRDYYQLEWPLRTRKYEYGVYSDEVLQNYFPPAFGVIKNIGTG